jgi:aminoglycoside 3-N-acetyltransferase
MLHSLGVAKGDLLCIYAFLPSLGVVEGGLPGIHDSIRQVLGDNGTTIVPTYTASYRRNEVYDVVESPSFNGVYSEYVRRLPTATRSLDPLFSMAAEGPDAERLMDWPTENCFGHGSILENLFKNHAKFLCLGLHWDQGYSFFMHLERLAQVPFRRDERIVGTTRDISRRETKGAAIHFVRRTDISWRRSRGSVGAALIAEGAGTEIANGGIFHRLFQAEKLAQATLRRLSDDPWCMTDRAR